MGYSDYTFEKIKNKFYNNPDEESWIGIEKAKNIINVVSKKKWKELRDNSEVDFVKSGKSFLYYKPSLNNYLRKNSTIKKRNNFF